MARITMADVARVAGVNKGTVSRALRGDRRISEKTRDKVWKAAKELGYSLDAVASGLSSKKSGMVGVVMECLDTSYTGELLSAVTGVLSRCKLEVMLFETGRGRVSTENILKRAAGRKVDGIIWVGNTPVNTDDLEIPVIRIGAVDAGCRGRVDIEHEQTIARINSMAGGRPVFYRHGAQPTASFIGEVFSGEKKKNSFIIWDRVDDFPMEENPDLICGSLRIAHLMNAKCMTAPVRELGVLAARVLSNLLKENGVCPSLTLVKPSFFSEKGELILH